MIKSIFVAALLLFNLVLCSLASAVEVETTAVAVAPTTEVKSEYNEAVIPLKLGDDKAQVADKQNSNAKMTLGFILVAVLLSGGIFYIRRYSASKESSTSLMQIKVVAQHYLGPKKSVAVIRVAGESLLIGITDNQINLIKGLAVLDEDMTQATANTPTSFAKINAAAQNEADTEQMNSAVEDEFSFADLKSTVAEKLKSVRGFQ